MIQTTSSNMPAHRDPVANEIAADIHHRTNEPLTILRGSPEYLSVIKPEACRDIEDFILDETGEFGVDKIGHELTDPTRTKFVFYLCLDYENDDEGEGITMEMEGDIGAYIEDEASDANEQVDSGDAVNTTIINETTTTKTSNPSLDTASCTEAARKARLMRSHKGISLASLIAAADSDAPPIIEAVDQDIIKSPTTHKRSPLAVVPRTSPDDDTSPEVARRSYLPRSKGSTSLAAIIAAASHFDSHTSPTLESPDDSDSDSDTDISSEPNTPHPLSKTTKSLRPCYDPTFPGHAPCATHRMRIFGRSHIAATQLLRDRFEAKCAATGYVGWYRAWVEVKREMMERDLCVEIGRGTVMVHGGSSLRFEVGAEEVQVGEEVKEEEEQEVMCDEVGGCDIRSDSLPEREMLDSSSSFEEDEDCPGASEMGDDSDAGTDGDDDEVGFEDGFVLGSSSPFDEIVGLYEETTAAGAKLDEDGEGVDGTERISAGATDHVEGISIVPESPAPSSRTVKVNNTSVHDAMSDKTSTRTSVFSRASGTTKSSRESRSTEDLVCPQPVDALHIIDGMVEGDKCSVVLLETRAPSSASSHGNSFEDFDFDFDFEGTQSANKALFNTIDDAVKDDGNRSPNVVARDERVVDDFAAPYEDGDITIDFYGPEDVPSRRFRWARKMAERVKRVSQKMKEAKRGFVKSSEQFTHTLAGFIPAALTGQNPFECA